MPNLINAADMIDNPELDAFFFFFLKKNIGRNGRRLFVKIWGGEGFPKYDRNLKNHKETTRYIWLF